MAAALNPKSLISVGDMKIIEHVLDMKTGYVLDFSDRSFNNFIALEIGVDATAENYLTDGNSKAKRFRRILHSIPIDQQAKLLRALQQYRSSTTRRHPRNLLDDEWSDSFLRIVRRLEEQAESGDIAHVSSAWTGRRSLREQVFIVRQLAPIALNEINVLAKTIENERFNDPLTADALLCLRELHSQIGELISAVDRGSMMREAVEAFEANRERLVFYLREGAKLTLVAPSMTFGIMHILAWISGVPIDSTMVSTVFGAIVGADALKSINKNSGLASR